jgi:hypothetical protein
MPRPTKVALIAISLCAGVLLTLSAMRFGVRWAASRSCRLRHYPRLEPREALAVVDSFIIDHGRCPNAERELVAEGRLDSLRDRWNQRLFYTCVHTASELVVEVRSAGPDRVFWTADDVVAK